MLRRRVLGPTVALAAVLMLAACVPGTATPTPTPTQLTEAEAYAAAEDAFRAYIDALNQIDVSDPATFEPAFALTTGRLNSQDRRAYSQRHADGWVETGNFTVKSISSLSTDGQLSTVDLQACLDASQVDYLDASGQSQVDPNRQDVQSIKVELDREDDRWLVEHISRLDEGPPC